MTLEEIDFLYSESHYLVRDENAFECKVFSRYKFAELIAEKEREACAKLFDDRNTGTGFYEPHEPAEIIRARGKA